MSTYKNHFDDEIFLIGTLESVVFCGKQQIMKLVFTSPMSNKSTAFFTCEFLECRILKVQTNSIQPCSLKFKSSRYLVKYSPMSFSQQAIFLYTSSHAVTVMASMILGMNLATRGSSLIPITNSCRPPYSLRLISVEIFV